MPYNTEKIRYKIKSKYSFKHENQVIFVNDGKKWHYLAVKSLSALFRGITSNHVGEFFCLNCFHSYSTKKKNSKNMMKYVMIMIIVM